MEFPQYRKYKGLNTFFNIISEKEFEETKVIGNKYIISRIEAKQFPERLLIQDMLENLDDRWETLLPKDFETSIEKIISTKTII